MKILEGQQNNVINAIHCLLRRKTEQDIINPFMIDRIKPHQCIICNVKFSLKNNLKRQTGIKKRNNFSAVFIMPILKLRKNIQIHIQIIHVETNESEFTICNKMFKIEGCLKSKKLKVHKG